MAEEGVDELLVAGYAACSCGEWLPAQEGVTEVICDTCRSEVGRKAQEALLEYEVEGRVLTSVVRPPKRTYTKKTLAQVKTRDLEARRAEARARERAFRRLSRIYRPMYEVIYAEELLLEQHAPVRNKIKARPAGPALTSALLADIADAQQRARHTGQELRSVRE